jgi:hypothetical protein
MGIPDHILFTPCTHQGAVWCDAAAAGEPDQPGAAALQGGAPGGQGNSQLLSADPGYISNLFFFSGQLLYVDSSVAGPGCPSRILIFDHPRYRIPDPKTATKERGEKNLVFLPFICSHKYTKLKIILFLNWHRKKIWAIYEESKNLLPKKLS